MGKSKGIGVIKRSIRGTINDQAFTTQKAARFKTIPKSMITRSKFNQSLIRVTKAKGRSLSAEVGAINKDKYKGLKNIEFGKTEKNPAIPLLRENRSNNRKRKIPSSKRLGKLGTFKKLRGRNVGRQVSKLSSSNYNGSFQVMGSGSKLSQGVYRFKGVGKIDRRTGFRRRNIEMIRYTKTNKTKPKKMRWLFKATEMGSNAALTNRFWIRNQDRYLTQGLNKLLK